MKVISICLSDIPKDKITTGKNTKKYVSVVVDDRKEKDKFGNDVTVYINQSKEERIAKTTKVYIGSGKSYNFTKVESAVYVPEDSNLIEDDLPF